ncbi:MAG: peptidoglycan DD-metalloendopeptidase family protein [Bacteroidota bacterium]
MRNRFWLSVPVLLLLAATAYVYFGSYTSIKRNLAAEITDKDTKTSLKVSKSLFGIPLMNKEVFKASFEPNQSLGEVLTEFNVSPATIAQIGHLPKDTFDVRKLQANKPYTIIHAKDSLRTAHSFIYQPNPIDYVVLTLGDSVEVWHGHHPVDTLEREISGTIQSSLYNAILESGGTPILVSELADVYAWAIDFFGLQGGDCFKVVYTTHAVEGKEAGFGEIKGASFTHMGKEILAIAYDQGEGKEYFDEEGNSLRKTFLKAPLRFSRISSRFSYSRMHPVLKYRRPHLGVDYAAPKGTHVQSVGDGVVIKAGWAGGAGRMIKIRHNANYTTAYLHLNGFAKGIRVGATVEQGQLIGYVGSTGLSTGPHLDFRFYKNGVPIDPLKVDPPSSEPIKEEHKAAYFSCRDKMIQRLAQVREAGQVLAMRQK